MIMGDCFRMKLVRGGVTNAWDNPEYASKRKRKRFIMVRGDGDVALLRHSLHTVHTVQMMMCGMTSSLHSRKLQKKVF